MRIAEEIAHSKGPKEEIVVAVVVVQPITLPFTANSPEATNLRLREVRMVKKEEKKHRNLITV